MMTKKEAQKACRWFQREIGLAGWTITVHMNNKPAFMSQDETAEDKAQQLGHSWTQIRLHDCHIWINPQATVVNDLDDPDNLLTLFHELLHGLFESICIQYDRLQEHPIDRLSRVLAARYLQPKKGK